MFVRLLYHESKFLVSNLVIDRQFSVSDDSDDHDRFCYTVHIFPGYCDGYSSTKSNVETITIIKCKAK